MKRFFVFLFFLFLSVSVHADTVSPELDYYVGRSGNQFSDIESVCMDGRKQWLTNTEYTGFTSTSKCSGNCEYKDTNGNTLRLSVVGVYKCPDGYRPVSISGCVSECLSLCSEDMY